MLPTDAPRSWKSGGRGKAIRGTSALVPRNRAPSWLRATLWHLHDGTHRDVTGLLEVQLELDLITRLQVAGQADQHDV